MPRIRVLPAAAAALLLPLFVACGHDDLGDLTVNIGIGTETPGFSAGEPAAGFDIAFRDFVTQDMEEQSKKAGTRFTVGLDKRLTTPQRETMLLGKKVTLVVATFSITEERRAMGIDFAGPYLKTDQAFLVRDQGRSTIDEPAELSNKNMCRIKGTTGKGVPLPGGLRETSTPDSTDKCVRLLRDGTVDVVFSDALILYGFAAQDASLKVTMVGKYGSTQLYGIGILGGRMGECHMLNDAITRYLNTRWRSDFMSYLGAVKTDYPEFESVFKPTVADMGASCQVKTAPT